MNNNFPPTETFVIKFASLFFFKVGTVYHHLQLFTRLKRQHKAGESPVKLIFRFLSILGRFSFQRIAPILETKRKTQQKGVLEDVDALRRCLFVHARGHKLFYFTTCQLFTRSIILHSIYGKAQHCWSMLREIIPFRAIKGRWKAGDINLNKRGYSNVISY